MYDAARLKTHRERKHIGITYPCDEGGELIQSYYRIKYICKIDNVNYKVLI